MPSFDIVSEVKHNEVIDAVDQANRQLKSRFDFNGVDAKIELTKEDKKNIIVLKAPEEFQTKQLDEMLRPILAKRGISVGALKYLDVDKNLSQAVQKIEVRQGIEQEEAKKIVRILKDSKLKVQGSIQGEKIRVTGAKRDDLQSAIALLKESKEIEIPLQFDNFRD